MGKRKDRREIRRKRTDVQRSEHEIDEQEEDDDAQKSGSGKFYACYLLTSLNPRHKGHTYIGFTVNPPRRIRQHNGEIRCGAWRTKKRRPWEMVLCIYGFPTNVAALQFEWAWQHPFESLAVRQAAATFKSLSGFANKIKLAYTMLTLPSWKSLKLTVNFFSTKYTNHSAGCPSLPDHMKVQVSSMDELPLYAGSNCENNAEEEEDEDEEEEGGDRFGDETRKSNERELGDNANFDETSFENFDSMEQLDSTVYASDSLFTCPEDRGVFGLLENNQYFESESESESDKLASVRGGEDRRQPFYVDDSSPVRPETLTGSHNLEETHKDGEDRRQPFCVDDLSLVRPETLTGSHNLEETHKDGEDRRQPFWVDDSSPVRPVTLTASHNLEETHRDGRTPNLNKEIEIIDVFTPSPCFGISSCRKKRRVTPQIIDLTESPIFV